MEVYDANTRQQCGLPVELNNFDSSTLPTSWFDEEGIPDIPSIYSAYVPPNGMIYCGHDGFFTIWKRN